LAGRRHVLALTPHKPINVHGILLSAVHDGGTGEE